MKTLFIVIIAMLSSGCAVDPQQFAQNFGKGLQASTAPRYQAQPYQPSTALAPAKQIDYACVTPCANAGNLYARCVSLCSY